MHIQFPGPELFVLGASGVASAALTGTTDETILATIPIPAGTMGLNGILRYTFLANFTNSANDKTLRARLGGLSGTIFHEIVSTTAASHGSSGKVIMNRDSAASQVGSAVVSPNVVGSSTTNAATGTVNTAIAQDFVITGQLESAGESLTLEFYLVELLKP